MSPAAIVADPIRVLHITDPHLFADSRANLRGTVTFDSLRAVLDHIEASAWPADLIALTGDLVQDDSRAAYERVRDLLSPLGLPVCCVPGNHDVRPLMQEVLGTAPFSYCGAGEYGNWLVAGIDSCREGEAAGEIAPPELERLDKLLRNTGAEHAMICLHHPPVSIGSRWLDEVGLQNGAEFLRRLAFSGKVRIAIFGHAHQAFEGTCESIRIVGTPSTCSQFRVGSDVYAVDDAPPAYRRITLHRDGAIDPELVRIGNGAHENGKQNLHE